MGKDGHTHDLAALAEKATVIAEATDRCEEDVLADLLDDGKANLTAGADAKDKAFLDKATEQAEKFKTLLTTLIPIIVLLGAIGAEGIGLLDMTSWGNESMFDDEDIKINWGCMDDTALNYDIKANEDNGGCEYPPDPIEGCTNSTAINYNETATVDDDSCEYPPPPRCDIELYDILMTYNNTSARVQYDLDCGYDEVEGFNVSIQFWTTCANETNTTNYTIGFHYIQGDTADIHELFLRNLTAKTYDFHWIAVWEDEDGELFNLTEQWSDIEITG